MTKVKETYLEVNQVPTRLCTLGKEVGDKFKESEDLVLIVPGNPGINGFYDNFAKTIHEKLQCSVWYIGHAGHNQETSTTKSSPKFQEHKNLYGLKGQVQHKVDFFERYVPKNAKVHLIGHSIGSYMILELLDCPSIEKRVEKACLLFPTIEYMAQTPNGKFLNNFVKYVVWLLILLSGLFNLFPIVLQNVLLNGYMFVAGIEEDHLENIRQLITPGVLRRVFFLAYEEMDQVLQRNNRSIKDNIKKIKFLYGKCDGWTPLNYYDNIKKEYPDLDAEVSNLNHAFVLKSSLETGDRVCDMITRVS